MDIQHLMRLRQIDEYCERRFEQLLNRLVGLPEAEGTALAEELLAAFNAFRVEQAMQVRRFFRVH